MAIGEDQGTDRRRRRSSITIAILARRHVTASDYIQYSENDDIHLLNNYNRDSEHAIYGFRIRAISSPILFLASSTSNSIQTIGKLNIIGNANVQLRPMDGVASNIEISRSVQNIDRINIIRGRGITIGPVSECEVSRSTENFDVSEIINAFNNATNSTGFTQNVKEINIFEGNDIQIGPRVVERVNINMLTDETEEGIGETNSLPALESLATQTDKRKQIRYKVAVFVFLTVVVGANICQIANKFSGPRCGKNDNDNSTLYIQLSISEWWFMCRWSWKAELPSIRTYLRTPIHYVVIGHSEFDYCDEIDSCIQKVQAMQRSDKLDKHWVDIRPNYLITPNGLVFEGRGANVQGDMLDDKYNNRTITIMFLGDYERNQTCSEQFDHLNVLLTELVAEDILAKDYSLLGECQINEEPSVSPGPNVMNDLRHMAHWHPNKTEGCIIHENLAQYMYG